ncbi:MAG: hypothetical protein M3126_00435 [Candidatus Eremiobacteraeota bacterium]|nr:hypothetical protein [Candidatus Eremiobacteraeota bacterium]
MKFDIELSAKTAELLAQFCVDQNLTTQEAIEMALKPKLKPVRDEAR